MEFDFQSRYQDIYRNWSEFYQILFVIIFSCKFSTFTCEKYEEKIADLTNEAIVQALLPGVWSNCHMENYKKLPGTQSLIRELPWYWKFWSVAYHTRINTTHQLRTHPIKTAWLIASMSSVKTNYDTFNHSTANRVDHYQKERMKYFSLCSSYTCVILPLEYHEWFAAGAVSHFVIWI